MQIAVIGGSGFVGTRLIEVLSGHQVTIVDKAMSRKFPNICTIADVRNKEALLSALKGIDTVVLLAAEHRDDVNPKSLYYDVNVQGTQNVLDVMAELGINNIIFTSSVAVYGLNKVNPDEQHPVDPFNDYGKSKYQAEEKLNAWYQQNPTTRSVTIIRPTVIFGERNRGNVYNLLNQIASGRFLMIGPGKNSKSLAYVGNIVEFIKFNFSKFNGYQVFNYTDTPDLSMNELMALVEIVMKKKLPSVRVPYFLGLMGGYGFDVLAKLTGKKLAVSSIRVKKFCATTQFNSQKAHTHFVPPFSLKEGLSRTITFEFLEKRSKDDDLTFISE